MPKAKKKGRSPKKDTKQKLIQLADRINQAWQRRAEDFYTIGELLNRAKSLKQNKKFKEWVTASFPFSYSTANNYMNVAKKFESPDDVKPFGARSLILMSRKTFPVGLRHKIVESGKDGELWPVERIQREWEDFKKKSGKKGMSSKKAKRPSKGKVAVVKSVATQAQAHVTGNGAKEAVEHLTDAAKNAARFIKNRKSIKPKTKNEYVKRIKQIKRIIERMLKEIELK